jgi:hypothetical protein
MTHRILVALIACLTGLSPAPSHAFDLTVVTAGIRARVGSDDVIGKEQKEEFHEYDVWASLKLPWQAYTASGWGVDTRLLTSIGLFGGGGVSAVAVSALPLAVFGTQDGRFSIDVGVGLALLSRSVYGQQDFGGYLQGALTFGVSIPLYRRFGAGYRFMHYSDAGIYGYDTIGADMHMLEVLYRF